MNHFLTFFLSLIALAASAQKTPTPALMYTRDWQRADSLAAKGLPKSALAIVNKIYAKAKADQNDPQVVKAVMHRLMYQPYTTENTYTEIIRSLQQDIADTPAPARNILQSILAETYWKYYEQNRWKFRDRATIDPGKTEKPADDLLTWDLRRLVSETIAAYEASLTNADLLKKTPVSAFEVVVHKGDPDARALRPTLYDFLAHRALGFYQNTEPDIVRPANRFELDQPVFLAEPARFVATALTSSDTLSLRFRALGLFHDLIRFHLPDANPSALADVDAARLAFVHTNSILPEKDNIYDQTLDNQRKTYQGKPAECSYVLALAELWADLGDKAKTGDWRRKAAALATDLIKRFPNQKIETDNARALLNRLHERSLSMTVEEGNDPDKPIRASAVFRNVPTVHYRIVRSRVDEQTRIDRRYQNNTKAVAHQYLKRKAVAEGTVALPDDGDLQEHRTELALPALPLGHYVLLTAGAHLTDSTELLSQTKIVVTKLGYLLGKRPLAGKAAPDDDPMAENRPKLYVIDRQTGQPLAGVRAMTIETYYANGAQQTRTGNPYQTDANGGLTLPDNAVTPNTSYFFRIQTKQDTLDTEPVYSYGYQPGYNLTEAVRTRVLLFTDRAIYRPGQPIYVKGVLYRGTRNDFQVVANTATKAIFQDVNGTEIATLALRSNEFGTVEGKFTAPIGRLTGEMTIQIENDQTTVRVEEYKRPTFEVTIDPMRGSFKLGQAVSVSANAKTFAGAVVDGAQVRYRVTRRQRPVWVWWEWGRPDVGRGRETEISSGTLTTTNTGTLSLTFVAKPDLTIERGTNPVFDFEITFDVTDPSGETRSASRTLHIGYTALTASLDLPAQLEAGRDQTFALRVTNASGERVKTTGQLTVYPVQTPARPFRKRLWPQPDRFALTRDEFRKLFPTDVYADEDQLPNWAKEKAIEQVSFSATNADSLKMALSRYPAGVYAAELTAQDSTGETVKQTQYFTVTTTERPVLTALPAGWIRANQTEVQPGKPAVFWLGNNGPGRALVRMVQNGNITEERWVELGEKPVRLEIPVTNQHRGGFVVAFTKVQNGELFDLSMPVVVPMEDKQLKIETLTFRDHLKPGQPEEWTLRISGPGKENMLAEAVATLYDASLDAFVPLNWPGVQSIYPIPYQPLPNWFGTAFNTNQSAVFFYKYRDYRSIHYKYDELSWFKYNFSGFASQPFNRIIMPGEDYLNITFTRSDNVLTGEIFDVIGNPTPGVTISLKGAKLGVLSDAFGKFRILLPAGDSKHVLEFSSVGYLNASVTLGTKNNYQLRLKPNISALQEVVKVGYGGPVAMAAAPMAGRSMAKAEMAVADATRVKSLSPEIKADEEAPESIDTSKPKSTNSPPVNPRRNFNETAFFFPTLRTDEQGRVLLKFTMPEALTRWRLLAFAHTKDMNVGSLERTVVTQKELMITANVPRFLREGDTLRLTARINNLTDRPLTGTAQIEAIDPATGQSLSAKLFQKSLNQVFTVEKNQSASLGWTLIVPQGLENVTFRVSAQAGDFTDAEERTIPVLPNRMLVLDSQPFYVNGPGKKEVRLKALANQNPELPMNAERLTVELTANPVWTALQSLPYLAEYPYECAEQLFSRFYANALAARIVNARPDIRQVAESWQKNQPANPLEANAELKSVTLDETPWRRDARQQNEQQAQLGEFLKPDNLAGSQQRALDKLQQLQSNDGGFVWFSGMPTDATVTLHILAGLGHLAKLGATFPADQQQIVTVMQRKGLTFADERAKQWVGEQQQKKTANWVDYWPVQYLYARSFYTNQPPADPTALAYLKNSVAKNWQKQGIQEQAMAAIALYRLGDRQTPTDILKSLLERSATSDELGMYWPDNKPGYFWQQAPIETQALLIEAFSEIGYTTKGMNSFEWMGQSGMQKVGTEPLVDNMKRWLLGQKRTQAWPSTKATTEAIYALLLKGDDWLNNSGQPTELRVGGKVIEAVAQGPTGYQKVTYQPADIKPALGVVSVTKTTNGPAWGGIYYQHFEPLDRVASSSEGTVAVGNLAIKKTLYLQRDSPGGPIMQPITAQTDLKPGDLLKVRVELRNDRDMEYVHLKDGRASGFEPVTALSGYKYQNGLGYYEAPRDASTDFCLSYLPAGTHVFEYALRVVHTGDFSTGVAMVQCFYAPEFSAHSAGERVRVK